MMPNETLDHDELIRKLGLLLEKDKRYALVKYFIFWHDRKTDLVGSHYPDVTCLRREGKTKVMIEVETPSSIADRDEIDRLEALSGYCSANGWEFGILCANEATRKELKNMIMGKDVHPKSIWLWEEIPFEVTAESTTDHSQETKLGTGV